MTDTETKPDEIIFEEVPRPTRNGSSYASAIGTWLTSLREFPNQTAKFAEPVSPGIPTTIKAGGGYGAKPGEFSAASRKRDAAGNDAPESRVWLYVTYLGEPEAAEGE